MSFARVQVALIAVALTICAPFAVEAQTTPHAAGTVKSIDGNKLVVTPDTGDPVTVTVSAETKILVIPPGTKTLAGATPAAVADIAVGDRALVNGTAGDTATVLTAVRVVLIKSTALAARDAQETADWQRRGTGGIVKSIDGSVITISSGARTLKIDTAASTQFRRFASDSVRFQDSKISNLGEIHVGDQLQARGNKSADGLTVTAEEVVTGSFYNLSGLVASVNAPQGTLTLKDLATNKTFTVTFTGNTQIRKLPPEAAARLAAMNRPPTADGSTPAPPARPAGAPAGGPPSGAYPGGGARRPDLSQMLARFPLVTLADVKTGDAVMIVASQGGSPSTATAITLLSGVEALLSAPAGAQPFTLSPWNLSAPTEGGGGVPQ